MLPLAAAEFNQHTAARANQMRAFQRLVSYFLILIPNLFILLEQTQSLLRANEDP